MFSWDTNKAIINFEKHGVSFEEALTIFADFAGLEWEDLAHSSSEVRFKRIGRSAEGRIIMVVFTVRELERGKETIRFISARPASRKEERRTKDADIDFSDIAESTDEELARARRVGRPKLNSLKQLIAIRLDPSLLKRLQKMALAKGKPYQTLIHELLYVDGGFERVGTIVGDRRLVAKVLERVG